MIHTALLGRAGILERRRAEMYIIAGLGNPKREYENTRHNIGLSLIHI